jgi:hypothetical protein
LSHHQTANTGRDDRAQDHDEVARDKRRQRDDEARRQRQFLPELVVEVAELGDHLHHDDGDDDDREHDQDGRIDERGDRLPLHARDDLHVGHVAAQDLFQVAGLFPASSDAV